MTPRIKAASRIILAGVFALLSACSPETSTEPTGNQGPVVGAERDELLFPAIANKRLGLVVNQSSLVRGQHLIDHLIGDKIRSGANVQKLFAVEHGIRGDADAGEVIDNTRDEATGLPIYSLYGTQKQPTARDLEDIDALVFDLQDVGVRFFTYLSSLHYVMQSCAETGVPLILLDRPNPNGAYIDGPVMEAEHTSFVGMHPIPVLHGMTLGELGQMINGEGWLEGGQTCDLTVIAIANYDRYALYTPPVRPSPNLPNAQAIQLYPSLALFEATDISVGRGTPFPFQVLGGAEATFGDFSFTPVSTPGAAKSPKHMDTMLYGEDLRESDIHGLDIQKLIHWHRQHERMGKILVTNPKWLAGLMGTDTFLHQVRAGLSPEEIKRTWQADLAKFQETRRPYLLYPE